MGQQVETIVPEAYRARSKYVHGDVLKDQDESEKLAALRDLKLVVRQIVLRWLVLTPYDTEDLAPLLDAAAADTGREGTIDEPLRAFLRATPPQDRTASGSEPDYGDGTVVRRSWPTTVASLV
ncbi:hypothetical protein [Streptomyces malaysiensis]|uniref:hypothetical protein n=1 Tax=Streptomyces malaysiensis TaxID=92644 RepID=UPI002B322661|nr:hypothetical protein R8789_08500 [Streptomyces malaysiensis]